MIVHRKREMTLVSKLRPEAVKPRPCLRCDRVFRSTGPGNRRCPKCEATLSAPIGRHKNWGKEGRE